MSNIKKLFVLDSSVLIHDPAALFKFEEHDVYLPITVLEELDASKKGHSDVARNARQVSRFLDDILATASLENIDQGLELAQINLNFHSAKNDNTSRGKLFFQTNYAPNKLPPQMHADLADNKILLAAIALQQSSRQQNVVLVSKDINLRIKAHILGISAEDFFSDKALDDVDLLHTGISELAADFWQHHGKDMHSWQDQERTFYRISGKDLDHWYPNLCLAIDDDSKFRAIVRKIEADSALIEYAKDYSEDSNSVWGIKGRNMGQNFALNLLMDPNIDFVSLMGVAGTGKTLLTLAAALAQVMDSNIYDEIIATRVTVSVGEDIGFLPGTEEEKMTPWMGAIMDNLAVLNHNSGHNSWEQSATNDLIQSKLKIRSLNFMRGRTFLKKFLIIDEAQNLTPKQIKTLITRAGPGSKIVCLGNVGQIDTPYLTGTTSGLTYAVDRFKNWQHSGHITLTVGERSRLADFANENL